MGGLNAANYMLVAGATTATTTRDLYDLVNIDAIRRVGERKPTRYFLAMDLNPVATVIAGDIF